MVSGVKGDDIRIQDVTHERVTVTLKFVVFKKRKKKENVNMQSCNVDDYKTSD